MENKDYNTLRKRLIQPEYGRCVQQMVDHAVTIADRTKRQQCAETIVALMARMDEKHSHEDDFYKKLWNHLAAMSDYQLDIDYPVEILRVDERPVITDHLPYDQHRIQKRHYGHILEQLVEQLGEMDDSDPDKKEELTYLLANQMKRSLANWNKNVLDDHKVADDLAQYTDGKVQIDADHFDFISTEKLLSSVPVQTQGKKKKKK
jgi:hypothetical protein